jgi:hypothetical protein
MATSKDQLIKDYGHNERSIGYALVEIQELKRKIKNNNSAGEDELNRQLLEKEQLHEFLIRKKADFEKEIGNSNKNE